MAWQNFPLFQSHLDLAHSYWQRLVLKGDSVIDATCGNGHDTLILAQLALQEAAGHLYAFDIQPCALTSTQQQLQQHLSDAQFERVQFFKSCHSQFPDEILPESIKLIVYNLGYLPGGDKKMTTLSDTTIRSLEKALGFIQRGGAISLTAYPGHEEGRIEYDCVHSFIQSLDPKIWNCCCHQWMNRARQAPVLYLIQRSI